MTYLLLEKYFKVDKLKKTLGESFVMKDMRVAKKFLDISISSDG